MLSFTRWAAAPVIAVMFLATAPSAALQGGAQATVVMKSGERHTGTNPRHRPDKGEFALRKSMAEEFRVAGNTVAYIDFGGAPDTNPKITGSQWAAVMRNGNVVRGQLIEMGHTDPSDTSSDYLVIFRDEQGQEHRWPVAQVGRVYFPGGAQTAQTTTTGTTATTGTTSNTTEAGGSVVVSAKQQWTATGITVRRGDVLTFNTTGQVQLSADSNDVASASGAKSGRYPTGNAPMPKVLAGGLLGRIGNGQPFPIGDQTSLPMPGAGQLFLGVNDDDLNDNTGEFRIEIGRAPRRR